MGDVEKKTLALATVRKLLEYIAANLLQIIKIQLS
jgi:hypothetical protein